MVPILLSLSSYLDIEGFPYNMSQFYFKLLGRSPGEENGNFSLFAWRILWTEEPGGPKSMGSQRVRYNWATNTFFDLFPNNHLYTLLREGSSKLAVPIVTSLVHISSTQSMAKFSSTKMWWDRIACPCASSMQLLHMVNEPSSPSFFPQLQHFLVWGI